MEIVDPEIRINEHFAGLLMSEFSDNDFKKESKEKISKKIISTSLYCEKLDSITKREKNILLPANCRYVETHPEGYLLLIEEPPAYRTITVQYDIEPELQRLTERGLQEKYNLKQYTGRTVHKFNLALPYVIFICNITKKFNLSYAEIFFRNKQLTGFGDRLFFAPLFNINSNQSICFGEGTYGLNPNSLIDSINKYFMLFWASSFNPDYHYNYDLYKGVPILNSYIEWQHYSKENPMFIFTADWKHVSENVGIRLERIKTVTQISKNRKLDYNTLSQLFYIQNEVKQKSNKQEKVLYYDVANTLYLRDDMNLSLNVGDEFPYQTKQNGFIEAFVSQEDSMYHPEYAQIIRKNKRFLLKITSKVFEYLYKYIEEKSTIKSLPIGNITIKPNDIISFTAANNKKLYREVQYIRPSLYNEKIEINLGGDYYFADALKDVEVIDLQNTKINGVPLEKGKRYFCTSVIDRSDNVFCRSYEFTFQGTKVDRHNNLSLAFFNQTYGEYFIPLQNLGNWDVMNISSLHQPNGLFRVGRTIGKFACPVHISDNIITHSESNRNPFYYKDMSPEETKNLLIDDTFFLPGFGFDTTFNIGDQVILANWNDPVDMLKPKIIESFLHNKETGSIDFILKDSNSNLYSIPYVDEAKHATVFTGRIRKITSQFGDLERGDKIVANLPSIQCFPKKDVNIIVAIIIDEGLPEPLVLCSNCCTLWYSDIIKMFSIIKKKDKKWKSIEATPINLSKIKPQAGDLIMGTTRDWRLSYVTYFLHSGFFGGSPGLKYSDLRCLLTYAQSYYLDRQSIGHTKYDTILSPRISNSKLREVGFKRGFPNPHGGLEQAARSNYSFFNKSSLNNAERDKDV